MDNQFQFKVGDNVRVISEGEDYQHRTVLGFIYDSEKGLVYKISSREVDIIKKEIINGIQYLTESEIELIPSEQAPVEGEI